MKPEDSAPVEVPRPTGMVRWEQQVGYVVSGVAAAGGIIVATSGKTVDIAGLMFTAAVFGTVVVAAALLLLVAVRHGHRVIAGMAGIPSLLLTRYFPIELALMALIFLLVVRTSNAQSRARRGMPRMTAAERRAAGEAHATAKRADRSRRKGQALPASAKTPAPNRRYTPPKPKPPPRPAPGPPDRRTPR